MANELLIISETLMWGLVILALPVMLAHGISTVMYSKAEANQTKATRSVTKKEKAQAHKKEFVENISILSDFKGIFSGQELEGGVESEKEKLARKLEDLM